MNRALQLCACAAFLALVTGVASAQDPSFELTLAPDSALLLGTEGETLGTGVTGSLVTTGLEEGSAGAQGWSVSVGSENCSIVDATVAGTAGAKSDDGGLQNGGFEKTELTSGDGNEGAVSAVVLSFTEPVTLPGTGSSDILRLQVEAVAPAEGEEIGCRVFFVDGRQGSGQPVDNKVTYTGATFVPTLGEAAITVRTPFDCSTKPLNLIFQGEAIPGDGHQSADLFANDAGGALDAPTTPGEQGAATAYVGIVSQLAGGGVQGWSLSIASEGVTVVGATVDGTAGAPATDGLQSGGFEKTEITSGENNEGAVSAIVLSFTQPITLDPAGTATVLRLDVEANEATAEDAAAIGRLIARDGLKGVGQPVSNVATVAGATETFCEIASQALEISFSPVSVGSFKSSDGNGDGKIDIADPIFLINFLFRDGPAPACADAADANGDGMLDLSDATVVIGYLFLGGEPPAGDLECHVDDASTPESCPASSTACDA